MTKSPQEPDASQEPDAAGTQPRASGGGIERWLWPLTFLAVLVPVVIYALHEKSRADTQEEERKAVRVAVDPSSIDVLLKKAQEQPAEAANSGDPKMNQAAPISESEIREQLEKPRTSVPLAKLIWIDDHPLNTQAARLALASIGVFADCYTNTADAIGALEWNEANHLRPYDIVVSDVRRDHETDAKGKAMSGIDTYKRIREIPAYRNTPFIFYAADGISEVQAAIQSDSNSAATAAPDVLLKRILRAVPFARF